MSKNNSSPYYFLGYSGIDGYLEYKNGHIDDLTTHESYVSQGMDSAAAIIKNGKIIAACAEERFTGSKHTSAFPVNAIKACLDKAGIGIEDISVISHNFNYEPYAELFSLSEYNKGLFDRALSDQSQHKLFQDFFGIDVSDKFQPYDHHDTHAAYAYETSGYPESLVIVADGLGEFTSISIYQASKDDGITLLKSYGPASSLGMLYSAITDHLGFVTNSDEYKIMGMAAYGNPEAYKDFFEETVVFGEEGSVEIKHLIPSKIRTPQDKETYRYFKKWLTKQVFPPRDPDGLIEQKHKDFTAALQMRLNEAMLHIAEYWREKTGYNNLCMAGGVALNCVANAYLAEHKVFENIYIAPAAADDGTALGAAMISMRRHGCQLDERHYQEMPFYGPEIVLDVKNRLIRENHLQVETLGEAEIVRTVGEAILNNNIVAWAQGSMEFGPRALGNRSILANPRDYAMRERLNIVTKQRESFRPFAPIVKEEALNQYFEAFEGVVYKHMLVNTRVREEYREKLQAVTHYDGTARVQSVSRDDLPLLWQLLDYVEQAQGIPILLNTSYNLKSMPIVCNQDDALSSYINSDIDLLVINDSVIRKQT